MIIKIKTKTNNNKMIKSKEVIAELEAKSVRNIKELEHTLTAKERKYWNLIKPNSGVLMLKGAPGTAKSAIMNSIATKLNLKFEDIRLASKDPVDIGSFPYPITSKETGITMLTQLNPRWMVEAAVNNLNDNNGTLMFFDELNRAPLDVRNAALQILLERTADGLKLPKHVYMASAGNLGAEDGTTVEELDGALRTRLIPTEHTLNLKEWKVAWADENVHSYILKFLEATPASYISSDVEADVIANARTWTFLSDHIICNYGKDSTPSDWVRPVSEVARLFVGIEALKFIRWCESNLKLSIKDILKAKSEKALLTKLKKANSLGLADLMINAKELDFNKLTPTEFKNIVTFIKVNQDEVIVEFILHVSVEIDEDSLSDKSTNYNKLLRVELEKWKDMVIEKTAD